MNPTMTETPEQTPDFTWTLHIADKVGKWSAKVRRLAILCNFIRQWRRGRNTKIPLTSIYPTVSDTHQARDMLIMGIQQTAFKKEINILTKQIDMPNPELSNKKLCLTSLNPFIDPAGLLRAGGRLSNATSLSYDLKYPKILPKDNEHITALIREEHERQGHAGTNHTFAHLTQTYWIINGREAVKKVIQKCVKCQRISKAPTPQKMGDLPAERADICSPFEATGADVFGPFSVKHGGRGYTKRWVLLFTCLACRGVHFETLRVMSAPALINALVRFHSRRPGLRILYTDCGTN